MEVAVTAEEFCRKTRQLFHFSFCQGPAGFKEMWGTFILHLLKFSLFLQHVVSKAGDVKVAMCSGVAMFWGQGSFRENIKQLVFWYCQSCNPPFCKLVTCRWWCVLIHFLPLASPVLFSIPVSYLFWQNHKGNIFQWQYMVILLYAL